MRSIGLDVHLDFCEFAIAESGITDDERLRRAQVPPFAPWGWRSTPASLRDMLELTR